VSGEYTHAIQYVILKWGKKTLLYQPVAYSQLQGVKRCELYNIFLM